MLKLDYSLFIQIANFLILLLLLNIVLYRPIRRVLSQRKEEMDSLEARAADLQGRSVTYSRELDENMAGARREGYREKESLKAEGLDLEKKMYQEATASAGEKMGQAKMEAEEKLMAIRETLVKEVDLFASEMAEKILGRSLR